MQWDAFEAIYTPNTTGITKGLFSVFWYKNFETVSPNPALM